MLSSVSAVASVSSADDDNKRDMSRLRGFPKSVFIQSKMLICGTTTGRVKVQRHRWPKRGQIEGLKYMRLQSRPVSSTFVINCLCSRSFDMNEYGHGHALQTKTERARRRTTLKALDSGLPSVANVGNPGVVMSILFPHGESPQQNWLIPVRRVLSVFVFIISIKYHWRSLPSIAFISQPLTIPIYSCEIMDVDSSKTETEAFGSFRSSALARKSAIMCSHGPFPSKCS